MRHSSVKSSKSQARSKAWHRWKQIILDWEKSGLTQKAFCSDRRINFSGFKNWRYRINHEKCLKKDEQPFVPIQITGPAQSNDETIKIEMPSGIKIFLSNLIDENALLSLVNILSRAQSC